MESRASLGLTSCSSPESGRRRIAWTRRTTPCSAKPISISTAWAVKLSSCRAPRNMPWRGPAVCGVTLLQGEHVSSDVAVSSGGGLETWSGWRGNVDYWTRSAAVCPCLSAYCTRWIQSRMAGYTGPSREHRVDRQDQIIEVHLRFADDGQIIGGGCAVVALGRAPGTIRRSPRNGSASFCSTAFAQGTPSRSSIFIDEIANAKGAQITFHEDEPASAHAMPPSSCRWRTRGTFGRVPGALGTRREALRGIGAAAYSETRWPHPRAPCA